MLVVLNLIFFFVLVFFSMKKNSAMLAYVEIAWFVPSFAKVAINIYEIIIISRPIIHKFNHIATTARTHIHIAVSCSAISAKPCVMHGFYCNVSQFNFKWCHIKSLLSVIIYAKDNVILYIRYTILNKKSIKIS